MGAGAVGSRAEHLLMVCALNRDERGCGEVVFIHIWPVSSSLAVAQCQSHGGQEESCGPVLHPDLGHLGQWVLT